MSVFKTTKHQCPKVMGILLVTLSLFSQKAEAKNVYIDPQVKDFPTVSAQNNKVSQLISHGRPGELLLDGKWRDANEIVSFIKKTGLVSNHETSLNIYGCEFAKGAKGTRAVAVIERKLGISVAASTNITGIHGDWTLEAGKAIDVLIVTNYPYDLQTICMDTVFTPINSGWSGAPANPSYSPPTGCNNNIGQTGNINGLDNWGLNTEYDNPVGYQWTRTLSGLSATNSYRVRVQMQSTGNSLDLRNAYFQNYNMAGQTGTFTALGGGVYAPPVSYNFIVTNKTSLSFSGFLVAAPWNGCDQAEGFYVNIYVDQIGAITPTYTAPTLTDSVGTNACPALTTNLTGEASGCGNGSTLEWHTTNVGYSAATKLADTTSVANGTYYAICHNVAKTCYSSPSAAITVTNTTCSTVPIDFKSSNVYWDNQNAAVAWTVANEVNNNYFSVERSLDGKNFGEIAQVKSVGNHKNDRDYLFSDANAKLLTTDKIFYRIRQNDIDGSNTATSIMMLSMNDTKDNVYVYPNPVSTGNFNLVYQNNVPDNTSIRIQITDAYGRSVYQAEKMITSGKNIIPIETNGLGAGMYFLKYNSATTNAGTVIRLAKKQ